jgi:hypothetical protein
MEEVSWHVGAWISRDRAGGVHWFVSSSDGLSHGHLVDEDSPTTLMAAVLAVRRTVFGELMDLHSKLPPETVLPPNYRGQ